MIKKEKLLIVLSTTTILLFLVVVWLLLDNNKMTDRTSITRDITAGYKLTSPILDYEELLPGKESVIPIGVIDRKVEDLEHADNGVSHIAFYYRDLNNGQWVGLNEKEDFFPASLLKVPVLIAFLKRAEKEPEILEKKVTISSEDITADTHQNIHSDEALISDKEYTLKEIARIMIQDSDNAAARILIRETQQNYIKSVFESIGVMFTDTTTEQNVRVKDYAGFFRVLYNASYLNRDMSELALELLSGTAYKDGLVAELPDSITVAHKFGERVISHFGDGLSALDETQIHDCGIVYVPKKPYILCIMTRGSDLEVQQNAIASLSHFVYQEVTH
jgi:beta-lactamase class A